MTPTLHLDDAPLDASKGDACVALTTTTPTTIHQ